MQLEQSKIELFKTLFKGREDVFAQRWEKDGKSGYMPAYRFDPYQFKLHKMKGGNFQNYTDKQYLSLSEEQIIKHLNGNQVLGLYPLLKDNSSWFIAADFDKDKWIDDCRAFIKICTENGIPAYLERSRSGKGGHVWIFFEQPYPAIKSRHIIISLLEKSGVFSIFDKSSSFDRLFPNQDFLSGKGFGNLIALPLNKHSLILGNSCFIDPETLQPFNDQWEYLKSVNRTSSIRLDTLYNALSKIPHPIPDFTKQTLPASNKVSIVLSNSVYINRSVLPVELINFLKEELNFPNTEFLIKKKLNKNTWGTERYFKFVEETGNNVIVPRGVLGKLLRFCKEQKIEYDFHDERKKLDVVSFATQIQLKEHQKIVLEATTRKDLGVLVAPPGAGKTIIALKIIAEKQQPALILVHRKQLAEQWSERIETFLGIPRSEIGKVGQGKSKLGKRITIALIQSLSKAINSEERDNLINSFGTIIVDECHHIPAESYRNTIAQLKCFYLYGLTATAFRKYNDGKLIFIHLGEVIAEIKTEQIVGQQKAKIIIKNTELDFPFNSKTDRFETLSHVLVHDTARNKLILEDITKELKSGKKVIIITERKEHIDTLYQYLKQTHETIALSGDDSESSRTLKWKVLKEGNYEVLITTGQFFGEGSDLQNVQCLFLVYPFSFKGKLVQYIGRVQRSEIAPTIYDYRDIKIDYLNKLFLKRNTYYRKIQKESDLFDEQVNETINKEATRTIDREIKVPIEQLEFHYGAIAFKYLISPINKELEFEIENAEIRPEFDVLKPYFAKQLKIKTVKINIFVEIQGDTIISQLATSTDLEKLNCEIIESVKFSFVSKNIIGKTIDSSSSENLLDIYQLQGSDKNATSLYTTAEDLLGDVLKNKNAKHFRQLRYLAQKHDSRTLKLRFVLSPFSFVFLLAGKNQFHIVLETLDTEEATYLWHFNKDKRNLRSFLQAIDLNLNTIRNKGRQVFLENKPENFSRIAHDYSDDRKGFIIWKDLLEERLI